MKGGEKSGLSLSSARSLSPSLFLQKKKKKKREIYGVSIILRVLSGGTALESKALH